MPPGQDAQPAAETAPPPTDVVLRPEEAARRVRLSVRTLRRYDADGSGPPHVRIGQRAVGYWAADLDAWLRARTSPAKRQHAA